MQMKSNIKLIIGVHYTVLKQVVDDEDDEPNEITLEEVGETVLGTATTGAVTVYNIESVKPTARGFKTTARRQVYKIFREPNGSNWSVKRFESLFAAAHTLKESRGSYYIPTPLRYAAPKCGSINIRNNGQECFRYCMLYHQSKQGEKTHRVTALSNIEDT